MSRFAPLGDRAFVAALPEETNARTVYRHLRQVPGVVDVVITESRAAVYGNLDPMLAEAALERAIAEGPKADQDATLHVIRVQYDGEDLPDVARMCGLSQSEVIALHSGRTYSVRMLGFQPGFAYLGPLAPALVAPRRATPRVRVSALSIGMAAHYTGIYPFESSGGWHLIGHAVDFTPFNVLHGATFLLGDHVQFQVAS